MVSGYAGKKVSQRMVRLGREQVLDLMRLSASVLLVWCREPEAHLNCPAKLAEFEAAMANKRAVRVTPTKRVALAAPARPKLKSRRAAAKAAWASRRALLTSKEDVSGASAPVASLSAATEAALSPHLSKTTESPRLPPPPPPIQPVSTQPAAKRSASQRPHASQPLSKRIRADPPLNPASTEASRVQGAARAACANGSAAEAPRSTQSQSKPAGSWSQPSDFIDLTQ
jgi:hypothetical protein